MLATRLPLAIALALVVTVTASSRLPAQDQDAPSLDPTAVQLWADFNHYVRIARPELAKDAATKLEAIDDAMLLDVLESSSDYKDWPRTLQRAASTETLKEVAQTLAARIQAERIRRVREADRIRADIQRLSTGERAKRNAIERFRSAGQFAAPHLLATLNDENAANLHPFVMATMVEIGEPMVYPLAVAIGELEPVQMRQVARVLSEIGYPRALPYLKAVVENQKVDPDARQAVASAFATIARGSNVPADIAASQLFLALGRNFYKKGTSASPQDVPGYDDQNKNGIVWAYSKAAGLVPVPVPAAVFADVLSMGASRSALLLDPSLDEGLTLWLSANLRRENRLDGATDPSYDPATMLAPAFYLRMAGPMRQHEVLDRALNDRDPALALDAIAALADTAGTDKLVHAEGAAGSLLRALSYPDRRVRWRAAQALTNARPASEFPGSHRVVPVLAEAVRQSADKFAVVVAGDQDTVNKMLEAVKTLGYKAAGGMSLDEVTAFINASPGIDMVVVSLDAQQVQALYRDASVNYKLAAVPIVAAVLQTDVIELNRLSESLPRVVVTAASTSAVDLQATVDAAQKTMVGTEIGEDEATSFAVESLTLLGQVALGSQDVFKVTDAQPTLEAALADPRDPVITGAAAVLAFIGNAEAQLAIAKAALDSGRPVEQRVALLGSLAQSARSFGNQLPEIQLDDLRELIKTSRGELSVAAAQAHGALALPTSSVVDLIRK